jgi:hypothetical protein
MLRHCGGFGYDKSNPNNYSKFYFNLFRRVSNADRIRRNFLFLE